MRPSARKTIRSACAAACASWVTMTIVWPWSSTAVRRNARSSDPLFESRLPVGSSAKTMSGRETRARAPATRCCWPPESSEGRWPSRSRRSHGVDDRVEPFGVDVGARDVERQGDVLLGRERRDQVERLEHEADPVAPQLRQELVVQQRQVHVADEDPAVGRRIEPGEDVQQRGLPRSRRAHDRRPFAGGQIERDAPQRLHRGVAGAVHLAQRFRSRGRLRVGRGHASDPHRSSVCRSGTPGGAVGAAGIEPATSRV